MDLFNVMTINEVKEIIKENFSYKLEKEVIELSEALGRITSERIYSPCSVPHFSRSTVDGYAVVAKDVYGASQSIPAILDLVGEVHMGSEPKEKLEFMGQCMYVATGSMLPKGADAVVMIEYTEKLDDKTIFINSPVAAFENVVQIGDDVMMGELVLEEGTEITAYEMGLLSGIGSSTVKVYKKPRIGVISTGDEIVTYKEQPKMGEIRDINSMLLTNLVKENHCQAIDYGVVKDDFDFLDKTMTEVLEKCDIVLVSGGSSVGKKDQTLRVINSMENSELLVHGIAIKPGKPTIIGKVNDKIVFGLPGHPLAAAVVFNVLVKDFISDILSFRSKSIPLICKMSINYHKAKGREEFLLVRILDSPEGVKAEPIFTKSGIISSMTKANGYIRIEKDKEGLYSGEVVKVYSL